MRAPPARTPLDRWVSACAGARPGEPLHAPLAAYRRVRLREALEWARRAPFYRERLAGAREACGPEDLPALPFTTADDLRREGGRFLCVSQDEVARMVTLPTSGTTGPPKRLAFTSRDQEATLAFFRVGMSTLVGRGDRVLVLLPGETPGSVGDLLARALADLGAAAIPHGFVRDLPAAVEVLRRERPTSLVGAPVPALALARYADRVAGHRAALRTALLTADHVSPVAAAALRALWGCEVFEHWGMTETGLGGGVDCAAHAGYHLRELDLVVEVVDPGTGRPVPDGAPGEVVVTTLGRRALPLVRYRTGDRSRLLAAPCACGSALRRLERVRGRLDDAARPLGFGLPDLDDALLGLDDLGTFEAVLREGPPARLAVTVRFVRGPGAPLAAAARGALAALPAVAGAVAAGRLALEVDAAPLGEAPRLGPEKRRILRGER